MAALPLHGVPNENFSRPAVGPERAVSKPGARASGGTDPGPRRRFRAGKRGRNGGSGGVAGAGDVHGVEFGAVSNGGTSVPEYWRGRVVRRVCAGGGGAADRALPNSPRRLILGSGLIMTLRGPWTCAARVYQQPPDRTPVELRSSGMRARRPAPRHRVKGEAAPAPPQFTIGSVCLVNVRRQASVASDQRPLRRRAATRLGWVARRWACY